MCDACVIESVKNKLISRRHLFKSASVGVAATTLPASVTSVLADQNKSYHDLTHTLDEAFPTFSGEQQFSREQLANFKEHGYNLYNLKINEHIGTHMDAPIHFSEEGRTVDQIEVKDLIVPLCVVDISARAESDPNAELTPDDLNQWISDHGDFPENACVAMYSGWEKHVGTDMFRNVDQSGAMHFPGFHVEAATMLLENTTARGLAVDTLSLDYGQSADFATHYAWLPQDRWGLENVASLDKLPASGANNNCWCTKIQTRNGRAVSDFCDCLSHPVHCVPIGNQ